MELLYLLLIILAVYWYRRRKKSSRVEPFVPPVMSRTDDDDGVGLVSIRYYDPPRETRSLKPNVNSLSKEGVINVAFVDTETTGLQKHDEVITLGIILSEVSMPKGYFVRQVDTFYGEREPSVPIHPKAAAVNGLNQEVLHGKTMDMARVSDLLAQADVLVAHNANFDRKMLSKLVPGVQDKPWRCSWKQVGWPSELENNKLDTICEHFSVGRPMPHNALSDAQAMADCLFMHTGKTEKSKTYLATCLSKWDL